MGSGSCSATIYACKVGAFCPPNSQNDTSCVPCYASQPSGVSCFCSADSKVENCSKCAENVCSECANSFYLAEQTCLACGENCKKCDATACTVCSDGYFLEDSVCKVCQNCLTCSSAATCLTCKAGQFLTPGGTCEACSENCKSCTTADSCDGCAVNSYLHGNVCSTCQVGQPVDVKCNCGDNSKANCISCSNNTCLACNTNYSLVGPFCYADQCKADSNCNPGQYCELRQGFLKSCKLCSETCKQCSLSSTQCVECPEKMYLSGTTCEICSVDQPEGASCNCGKTEIYNCNQCSEGSCSGCFGDLVLEEGKCIDKKSNNGDMGKIVGIVIGVVVGVLLLISIVIGVVCLRKHKKNKMEKKLNDNGVLLSETEKQIHF